MSVVGDAVQAAMKKAVEMAPDSWMPGGRPDPLIRARHGIVGKPVSRIDGPLKVAGKARFAAEFPMEGLLYAALAFSGIPKGRITSLDTAAAEAAPGVAFVMTHRNAPRLNPTPVFMSASKAAGGDDLPVMQDENIHWNGQPIAVVLAESQEEADHAASLVHAEYAAEDATTDFEAAKKSSHKPDSLMGEPPELKIGDAESALAAASRKVDQTFRTPRHNHNAIEPHAVTLHWQGDELTIHDCTQAVSHVAWSMSKIFGIEESEVHVSSPYVGGGFGSKSLWQHQILAAAAAKAIRRPVRLVLSRESTLR